MSDFKEVAALAEKLERSIRRTVQDSEATDKLVILNSLAAAVSIIVSYDSMQVFLETLAECADAKERVRTIAAGEVPDVH